MKWQIMAGIVVCALVASQACIKTVPAPSTPEITGDSEGSGETVNQATQPVSASAESGKMVIPEANVNSFSTTAATLMQLDIADTWFPKPGMIQLTATVQGSITTMTRLVVNGSQLATVKQNYNTLLAAWIPKTQGTYRLWVGELPDLKPESNYLTVVVGSAAKSKACAGGLLSQTASAADVTAYETKYDTLNCYYMQPPRCAMNHVPMNDRDCTP